MSFNPQEYAGPPVVAHDPAPERCNHPLCDHADDEELSVCDSCHGKTCAAHAKRYAAFVLCRNCGATEYAAKLTARCSMLSIDMVAMDAGQIAETLLDIANQLENWDVEVKA